MDTLQFMKDEVLSKIDSPTVLGKCYIYVTFLQTEEAQKQEEITFQRRSLRWTTKAFII